MPEQAATLTYSQNIEALSSQRDVQVKDLVEKRGRRTSTGSFEIRAELAQMVSQVTLAPFDAVPECVEHWKYLQQDKVCSAFTPESSKLHLSPQFRSFISSVQIAGAFDPRRTRQIRPLSIAI